MKKKSHSNKRKLRLKTGAVVKFGVFCLLLIVAFIYYKNVTIKQIVIKGNDVLKDVEIIEAAGIAEYPRLFETSSKKLEKIIDEVPLVQSVKVKKSLFGKVTITINEEKILFFYNYNNKYITTDLNSIDNKDNYYGYPILINFTPDTVFEALVNGFKKIDYSVIKMINEIEYMPYKDSDGKIVDETRFYLKMNDGNTVVIDTLNIRKLANYDRIYASLGMDNIKGTLYLDTITEDNIYFESYEAALKSKLEKEEASKKEEANDKKEEG